MHIILYDYRAGVSLGHLELFPKLALRCLYGHKFVRCTSEREEYILYGIFYTFFIFASLSEFLWAFLKFLDPEFKL